MRWQARIRWRAPLARFRELRSSPSPPLPRQTRGGAFVENLLQVECENAEDAMLVFHEGMRNRKVSAPN